MIKFFLSESNQVYMLCLVLAEAALELIPKVLCTHPSVIKHSRRVRKRPKEMLLDRTYHHRAMLSLADHERRGRPDIVHLSLLGALNAPLNAEGLLLTYVHTYDNHIISINSSTRLPKNYERFKGLIEQLYLNEKVPERGSTLLHIMRGDLTSVIKKVNPKAIIAFSKYGRFLPPQTLYTDFILDDVLMIVVGAFPRGQLSAPILNLSTDVISIDKDSLPAWIVASRLIYDYELIFKITQRRRPTPDLGNKH